jgi:predicted nicotinamide N-methyase
MQYPVELTQISAEKAIYVPAYDAVKAIHTDLLAVDPATPFPYWAKVWPSAIALVKVLQKHPSLIRDKKVLELGAGIGLPSLMMASEAKTIQVSDYDLEAVELLRKNIAHLQLQNVKALQIDWNDLPENINPEVIILSDVNYDPTQFETLIKLIEKFIHQGCAIILSTPQRIMASPFVLALSEFIITDYLEMVDENGVTKEISILVLSKNRIIRKDGKYER